MPRPGQVLGLVGTNGIGKSTALNILAGKVCHVINLILKVKPNLGRFGADAPDWEEILKHFRGSELQNYFTKLLEDNLTAVIKPQYVDIIPRAVKGTVIGILDSKEEMDNKQQLIEMLDLKNVLERDIALLSGGELQRFAIAVASIRKADMFVV